MAEERRSTTAIFEGAQIDIKYVTNGKQTQEKPHYIEVTGKLFQMQLP